MLKHQTYTGYFFVQDMPSYPCTACARRGRNESCMCGAWKDVFCTAYNSTRVGLQNALNTPVTVCIALRTEK